MIDSNKKYRLRDGSEYRNYCTDAGGKYPIHGAFKHSDGTWIPIHHTESGRFMHGPTEEKSQDLVEIKPYENWETDDAILVRNDEKDEWVPRHFAGISELDFI